MDEARAPRVEWPTVALLGLCYVVWGVATTWAAALWLPLGVAGTGLAIALHSSLCHEALHGHPTRAPWLNEALVWPALGLMVPYGRFRDTHLAHHRDAHLTDPYDDPETNYLHPTVWKQRSNRWQAVLRANNTLLGRMVLGPWLGLGRFLRTDLAAIRRGDRAVRDAWLRHIPAAAVVLVWIGAAPMPLWAYGIALWIALALLKIRTFLEHRAHDRASGRTVIVEDRGPLAVLFLNNNLHVVHHMHPEVAWYRLPALYAARRAHYLRRNGGYRFDSYSEVFRRYLWRAKDPVAHPLRRGG